ncbi:deoxyribonuclease IV [Guggenheimella bovis]
MNFLIGCHLSSSKGFRHMLSEMERIGANTFQYFSRNPRGSGKKAIDPDDLGAFLEASKGYGPFVAHAPYTLNPASKDEKVRQFAGLVFEEDLEELKDLPEIYYNFHPGSHVGDGVEVGINRIVEILNRALDRDFKGYVLLEGMAGKGTEIGSRFEELQAIIERVENRDHVGVLLDTCHLHEAGYDIIHDLDGVLKHFDEVVGLDRLKAIHLNDSKNPIGAHKDRHEKIGQGHIGIEALTRIINHPLLAHLPFNLETPNEIEGYAEEIKLLKGLRRNE